MMALLLQNSTINIQEYNLNELSVREYRAISASIRSDTIKLIKLFIVANGASGASTDNISPNLAGFFCYSINNKCFRPLQEVRSEINERYNRLDPNVIEDMDDLIERFTNIKGYWNHMVVSNNNNRDISISNYDSYSFDEIKDKFVRMSEYTIEDYEEYTGPSWLQWYNLFKKKFDEIEKRVNTDSNYYNRSVTGDNIFQKTWSSIVWLLGFFNPRGYYNNVTSGFQTYASIRRKHGIFKDKMIIPKKTVISSRLEDLRMAIDALNRFETLLNNERVTINDPKHLINESKTHFFQTRFKSEVDRLLGIFTKRVGTISNLNNTMTDN